MNFLVLSGAGAPARQTTAARAPTAPATETDAALTEDTLQEFYLPLVFAYVSRRIRPVEEAEDVTADVFAAAYTSLHRRRAGSLGAWLLGIARRKVADALRRRGRRRESSLSDLSDDALLAASVTASLTVAGQPEAALAQSEAHETLRALVGGLKSEQREVLLLKYVDGLSVADIAIVIGRSPAAVNSLLQRTRAILLERGRAYFLPDDDFALPEVTR